MDTLFFEGDVQIETMQQAVELFARDGMPARNLAAHTRKNYLADLTDLVQFLTNRRVTRLADVSLRHLEAYQAEMDRRGYASSTRNRKTQSIRILFQFLALHAITQSNLAERLIPPAIQRKEPRFLTEAEYQRRVAAAGGASLLVAWLPVCCLVVRAGCPSPAPRNWQKKNG